MGHDSNSIVHRRRTSDAFGLRTSLVTTTTQPLWSPAQPQSEQRQLIPPGSFFLFLPRLCGKTIFSESGQRSILPGMKLVSTDSQGIKTTTMNESMLKLNN
jgi:hypothetical protein